MAITNKDVEKLKEVFATKEDLNEKFREVLAGQDRIIKELETARGDRTLGVGKDREQDRRLDGLEKRMTAVEAGV